MDGNLKRGAAPLYLQLSEALAEKVHQGVLKAGDPLPSERSLCDTYGVSRITVRQALALLEKQGLIYRSHGRGSFVAQSRVEQDLAGITPFEYSILATGSRPSTKVLFTGTVPNDYRLSKVLGVPLSVNVEQITLLGLADDVPVAFYTSQFEPALGEEMIERTKRYAEDGRPFTTFDLYKEIPGAQAATIHQVFEASVADAHVADLLHISKGSPILMVESTVYSRGDRPLEFRYAVYRADKYRFSLVRPMPASGG